MTTVILPTLGGIIFLAVFVTGVGWFADRSAYAEGFRDGYAKAKRET